MPKNFIKKYLPDPHSVKDNKSLRFLGPLIHEPNLWHLNRHCVAKAFAIGLFWGCIPTPFQMVIAAFFALRFNANLPLSVALVWFSNPVTMPPIFYAEYLLGAWILDMPAYPFEFQLSFSWIKDKLFQIGLPMFLGAIITGAVLSAFSYYLIHWAWKKNALKKWHKRREERAARNCDKNR